MIRIKGKERVRQSLKRGNISPSAVPKIEHQIPHEPNVTMLNINRSPQSSYILSHIVAKDDRSH